MANKKFDLSELTTVPKTMRRKKQPYHLRYLKEGRFRISDDARIKLNIENGGLKLHVHPDSGDVFLSCRDEEESDFFKKRGEFNKGNEFTNRKLRKYLNESGHKGVRDFQLEDVGKDDEGNQFYLLAPWEDEEDDDMDPVATNGAVSEEEDDEDIDLGDESEYPDEDEEDEEDAVAETEEEDEELFELDEDEDPFA